MFGYIVPEGRGAADILLAELARQLLAEGWPLAGVIQINRESASDHACDMDLLLLGHDHNLRISQRLGRHARGCRLDPQGLETAAGLVAADLGKSPAPALLIINKFGKSELGGGGFRPVIANALMRGIPVLTAVNRANLDGFVQFADDMAELLPPRIPALLDWCRQQIAQLHQSDVRT